MQTADPIKNATLCNSNTGESLFERIANDLVTQGYSIQPNALPAELTETLWHHISHMESDAFATAGVGREHDHQLNEHIRNDETSWITGETVAGVQWLNWTSSLQNHLNRQLFLGLFSFESHFAHYPPGGYYRKHFDAFKGQSNRVLSLVVYLNRHWSIEQGGELILYRHSDDTQGIRVVPTWGTVVAFLSEEFPHEVRPANRDRHSIAGWFRVNTSTGTHIDPPQ